MQKQKPNDHNNRGKRGRTSRRLATSIPLLAKNHCAKLNLSWMIRWGEKRQFVLKRLVRLNLLLKSRKFCWPFKCWKLLFWGSLVNLNKLEKTKRLWSNKNDLNSYHFKLNDSICGQNEIVKSFLGWEFYCSKNVFSKCFFAWKFCPFKIVSIAQLLNKTRLLNVGL
jgi:hypothetical protein